MKVLLHYEDNDDTELWKSLKITLPKSWKNGPTSNLLRQFVESYNANDALGGKNPLATETLHLAMRKQQLQQQQQQESTTTAASSALQPLASDAIVLDVIPDRADVYIRHGPSPTLQDVADAQRARQAEKLAALQNTVQCTRFGCQQRFPRGGPYPDCRYHAAPPVFHETVKFWSCCPNKKAYDWETFQSIPGCQTGQCTEVKEEGQKLFLGGTDLREPVGEATKLKSIDDFNKAQAAGGADAAPVLERLQVVLADLGVEKELYQQVVDGIKKELSSQMTEASEVELLAAVKEVLGSKLKASFKAIAAEQLRIK